MNIQPIAEHSVDLDLLSGGICIDVGCRGFQFSEAMRDLGCKVLAMDIELMLPPEGIRFMEAGLLNYDGYSFYTNTRDQQAKHLFGKDGIKCKVKTPQSVYDQAISMFAIPEVDILKIDIEGSEYLVLSDPNFQPIPKQISVEFHMHAHRKLHDQYYDKCMENLLRHYEPVKHALTQAHGAGWNYWDSLWIRKDLI